MKLIIFGLDVTQRLLDKGQQFWRPLCFHFWPWYWRQQVPLTHWYLSTNLCGVLSHNMAISAEISKNIPPNGALGKLRHRSSQHHNPPHTNSVYIAPRNTSDNNI